MSQFKKKVTRDDTFDIFIFLRNRIFQQNKAHGVDFSDLLYFLSEKSRQNISNKDLDIYHFCMKTEKNITRYNLTFAVNVPSNLNKGHIYKNENLNQIFCNSASNFLKSDL